MIGMGVDRAAVAITAIRMKQLASRVQRQILQKAGNAAAKPILQAMKAEEFPEVSRELRRHLAKKVKAYTSRVFVAVGARSEKLTVDRYEYYRLAHERWFKHLMERRGPRVPKTITMDPAKYSHLAGPGRKGLFVKRVQSKTKAATVAAIREVLISEVAKR